MNYINENIKNARLRLGYTQKEASEVSGIKQSDISKLESGERKFIPKDYILFLHKNGVDINILFTNDDVNLNVNLNVNPNKNNIANEHDQPYRVKSNANEQLQERIQELKQRIIEKDNHIDDLKDRIAELNKYISLLESLREGDQKRKSQ